MYVYFVNQSIHSVYIHTRTRTRSLIYTHTYTRIRIHIQTGAKFEFSILKIKHSFRSQREPESVNTFIETTQHTHTHIITIGRWLSLFSISYINQQ